MEKINISLTVKQTIAVLMAVNERINSNHNTRTAFVHNMRTDFVQRGEDKQRLEFLDDEDKLLAETYQAILEEL